jgi:PKD repeat protein
MKKLIILSGIVAVIFASCEVQPYADFSVSPGTTVQPYDVISFNNYSDRAVSYEWDFGDGTFSNLINPTHYYTQEGIYQVSLRAVSEDHNVDIAYLTIEVIYTLLQITVVEWNSAEQIDWLVEDAFVLLYPSENAWVNDYGVIASGYTDHYGEITFAGLDAQQYYVWAERVPAYTSVDGYDNYNFYTEGLYSYIRTPVLAPFALNTWIAWVDYFDYYQSPQKEVKKFRHEKYSKNQLKSDSTSLVIVGAPK